MKISTVKVVLCICLVVLVVFSAVACGKDEKEIEYNGEGLVATVVEAHDGYLLIEPREGSLEASSSDRFSVPNYFESRVKKGDTVIIEHDGSILETYPAAFGKIFSMTLVGDNGINESVAID